MPPNPSRTTGSRPSEPASHAPAFPPRRTAPATIERPCVASRGASQPCSDEGERASRLVFRAIPGSEDKPSGWMHAPSSRRSSQITRTRAHARLTRNASHVVQTELESRRYVVDVDASGRKDTTLEPLRPFRSGGRGCESPARLLHAVTTRQTSGESYPYICIM